MNLINAEKIMDDKKLKVTSAEIVVHGNVKKPYFEIKYRLINDKDYHIGYSSYNLDFVFEWLDEYFEIVKEGAVKDE